MKATATVTFAPSGRTATVAVGATLADAARDAGVLVATPCAGRGVCGGCGVRVRTGQLAPADDVEARGLRHAPEGVRLACRALVFDDVTVEPVFALEAGDASLAGVSQPYDTPCVREAARVLVAGVDLGTTSVAALIADEATGLELARASVANRQQSLGADVLTRISAAESGKAVELRDLAERSVAEALHRAANAAGVDTEELTRVVIACNSAMAALIAGDDPAPLARHPFEAPNGGGAMRPISALAVALSPDASVSLVAPIASFVGGDALAATLAAGLVDAQEPALLVDFGTNAEIVLAGAHETALVVTSTAAGPAFEGVGVACGGPAVPGAVTSLDISGNTVTSRVIGGGEPRWLSGSGLVSAIAELREVGHIAPDGLLLESGPLAARFARDESGVLGVDLGTPARPLVLSQLDVRAFQLAKAAIRVGIDAVLEAAGIGAGELAAVYVAGAFGSALDPDDLIRLGVLPADAPRSRAIGNAALDGAASMALDARVFALASSAALGAIHVDLAADAAFGQAFLQATEFPV